MQMDLEAAVQKACGELPDGWTIELHMEKGAGYVSLFGPDDKEIELDLSDSDLSEQIQEALMVAIETAKED